jgi:hypothetical protein
MNTLYIPPSGGGVLGPPSADRVQRGLILNWNDTADWHDRDDCKVSGTGGMLVMGMFEALQRWQEHRPYYITQHPLPDPEQLNAKIPQSEWELDMNDDPTPPWKRAFGVYLVNEKTGTLYTYCNTTVGARMAIEQLSEAVTVMCLLRGEDVLALVDLQRRPFKTAYGMKSRPHLHVLEYRRPKRNPGGAPSLMSQTSTPQISGPSTPAASTELKSTPPAAVATSTPATPRDTTEPVKPVTVGEFIKDEMPPWA